MRIFNTLEDFNNFKQEKFGCYYIKEIDEFKFSALKVKFNLQISCMITYVDDEQPMQELITREIFELEGEEGISFVDWLNSVDFNDLNGMLSFNKEDNTLTYNGYKHNIWMDEDTISENCTISLTFLRNVNTFTIKTMRGPNAVYTDIKYFEGQTFGEYFESDIRDKYLTYELSPNGNLIMLYNGCSHSGELDTAGHNFHLEDDIKSSVQNSNCIYFDAPHTSPIKEFSVRLR